MGNITKNIEINYAIFSCTGHDKYLVWFSVRHSTLGNSIGIALFLNGNVHALLLVSRVVLGQDSQQRAQTQPPLLLGYALTKVYISIIINVIYKKHTQ